MILEHSCIYAWKSFQSHRWYWLVNDTCCSDPYIPFTPAHLTKLAEFLCSLISRPSHEPFSLSIACSMLQSIKDRTMGRPGNKAIICKYFFQEIIQTRLAVCCRNRSMSSRYLGSCETKSGTESLGSRLTSRIPAKGISILLPVCGGEFPHLESRNIVPPTSISPKTCM